MNAVERIRDERQFIQARYQRAYQIGLERGFSACIGPALLGKAVDDLPLCDAAVRQVRSASVAVDAAERAALLANQPWVARRAASSARKYRPGRL